MEMGLIDGIKYTKFYELMNMENAHAASPCFPPT